MRLLECHQKEGYWSPRTPLRISAGWVLFLPLMHFRVAQACKLHDVINYNGFSLTVVCFTLCLTWFLTAIARNKLTHALHGNGVSLPIETMCKVSSFLKPGIKTRVKCREELQYKFAINELQEVVQLHTDAIDALRMQGSQARNNAVEDVLVDILNFGNVDLNKRYLWKLLHSRYNAFTDASLFLDDMLDGLMINLQVMIAENRLASIESALHVLRTLQNQLTTEFSVILTFNAQQIALCRFKFYR